MTKYRLLKPIPHTDYEVGHVFEYQADILRTEKGHWIEAKPHEILLLVLAGVLEEVKEEEIQTFPKYGDEYWYIDTAGRFDKSTWKDSKYKDDDEIDDFRMKSNNVFKTKVEAQAKLKEIMEK